MKKILLSFVLIAFSSLLTAQAADRQRSIDHTVKKLTALYKLNSQQVPKVEVIVAREFQNLEEIKPLENVDYKKYLLKKKGVILASEGSLKRILNEEQLKVLNNQKVQRRKKESAMIREMKSAGMTKEEMEMKLLELY